MNLSRLRKKMRSSPAGRAALALLSTLYGLGVCCRNALYALRLLPSQKLKARTICIGNLTTGGTGKTTAVLLAAQTLHKNERRVAILSRGYRRPDKTRAVKVLSDAQDVNWREAGDEPWMMHRALKGMSIPILVSPDRFRSGRMATEVYGAQTLLLDDGFQHRRLGRDVDIVLLNALDPFGGGSLLPKGNLREPLKALKRADLLVITHSDRVEPERIEEVRKAVAEVNPRLPMAEAVHRADFLYDLKQELKHRPSHLKGRKVACMSGLGEPRAFEDELRRLGAQVVQAWRFPDHHPYSTGEIRSVENARGGIPLVTTFKDAPRLPERWRDVLSGEVLALGVKMEIVKGRPEWEEALRR